jgi:hypothetical protein
MVTEQDGIMGARGNPIYVPTSPEEQEWVEQNAWKAGLKKKPSEKCSEYKVKLHQKYYKNQQQ